MPPKKSKAAAAAGPRQNVEPVQQPQRQTRAGRKRRHSDTSDVSEQSQSINYPSAASTPAKRRKRTRVAASAEPAAIIEEEEEVEEVIEISSNPTPARANYAVIDGTEADMIGTSPEKHVHFPSGRQSQTVVLNDTDEPDKSTLDSLTPHPSKTAGKLRQSVFSEVDIGEATHQKLTSTRHSLPPQLSQDGQTYVAVDELRMAPLSEVLRLRMQRRLQLHKARNADLRSLEAQLETASEESKREIKAEMAEIREAQRHSIELAPEDEGILDDNMLVLESHQQVEYPELPRDSTQLSTEGTGMRHSIQNLLSQSTSLSTSQRTRDEAWDIEREQFRSAIVSLSDQANEARTKLQILEIELNALELGEGTDGIAVVTSIRESFAHVRSRLEHELPGSVPEGASNGEVVELLLANVHEFAARLRTADQELYEKATVIANLRDQVNGLLNHLAENKLQKDKLQETNEKLDVELDRQACDLQDVDAELATREEEIQTLQDEIKAKEKELQDLTTVNEQQASTVEKLSASLREYQLEETRLSGIITAMEEQHAATVKSMNVEREKTVRELEDRVDEKSQDCEAAERMAEERRVLIIDLESKLESLEQERDALRVEVTDVTAELHQERQDRETAEGDLDARNTELEELEDRVARTEQELAETVAQLAELRTSNLAERTQREAAEADLDKAGEDIEKLEEQLTAKGGEANELRSKLWQVQQENTRTVKELEELALQRDQQFQADIEAEVERRQDAEAENEQLRGDLENAQDLHKAQVIRNNEEREEHARTIAALHATIQERENEIAKIREEATMDAGLHSSEMEDRNARIAELNHEVADLTEQVRELRAEKISLEQRVEQEAEQMLQLQAEKEDQIDALTATISDKQAKIVIVEHKAHEADRRWQELLQAREEEIRELKVQVSHGKQTVSAVVAEHEAFKRQFREYYEKSSAELLGLKTQMAHMANATKTASTSIIEHGAELLEELEAMDSVSALVTTTSETSYSSQSHEKSSRATRASKKKRVVDSGIGMVEDEEESPLLA